MPQRISHLIMVVIFASATCLAPTLANGQDEVVKRLYASWKGDKEKTLELLEEARVDENQIESLIQQLEAMTMTFTDDKTFKMKMQAGTESVEIEGSWKLISQDEAKSICVVQIKMNDDFGGNEQELTCTFMGMGEFVKVAPKDQPAVVLKKVEE